MGFTVIFEKDQGGGFVVSVPALPGCISQGDTREEAMKNIREAVAVYVQTLKAEGKPIPQEAASDYIELDELDYGT